MSMGREEEGVCCDKKHSAPTTDHQESRRRRKTATTNHHHFQRPSLPVTMAELDVDRFLKRLNKLHNHFVKHKYVLLLFLLYNSNSFVRTGRNTWCTLERAECNGCVFV